MALNLLSVTDAYIAKIRRFFTVTKITLLLLIIAIICTLNAVYSYRRIKQIDAFNLAVSTGKPPETDLQSFEAKF